MPIRAARSIVKKLSYHYHNYGKAVASRSYLLLTVSLTFIAYFSLPITTKYFNDIVSPTTYNNIPLSHISTSLDAQCWHASAHVEFNNFSSSRNPPTNYLITEQIRLSYPNKPINYELIQHAKKIYEAISTTTILNNDNSPVSLSTICYKHKGSCLIHSPPFQDINDESDWILKTQIVTNLNYESHPYSIYSNATFDQQGHLIKADAVLLTFVLNQTQHGTSIHIWNKILKQVKLKYHISDIHHFNEDEQQQTTQIWSASSNITPHMIQYKFNLFPFDIPGKVQFSILAYMAAFYVVSILFGKSNQVKSSYSFALAAVFLSIATFTTTWGIFDKFGVTFHSAPWYLLLLFVNIGCLENMFLFTNAVLNAGCDMIVKEKISRGLQSVGVPTTATLIAELLILSVGSYMDSDLITEFCTFMKLALIVEYFLELTFVIAVLSIEIKRVELTDLDDRKLSKRLHELAGFDHDKDADFCPIQDTENKDESKSCAECKDFKTHRLFNSFMLCLLLLFLSLFSTNGHYQHTNSLEHNPFNYQPDLNQLSDQFWSTVNPQKDITWLQIQPPLLFIYDTDIHHVKDHLDYLQHLYQVKSMAVRYKIEHRPSLFRMFILSSLQKVLVLLLKINVPVLILCLVMITIITWMTPKWRNEWLVPILIHCFNQFFLTFFKYFPIKRIYLVYIKGQSFEGGSKEYDADGIHHRGAITVQNIFNQQQYRANVKTVQVRTLTNQHITDIQSLDANAKQSLVSCGHDGRVVLWNVNKEKASWKARLDKLHQTRGGVLQAKLNPAHHSKKKHHEKYQQKNTVSLAKNFFSKPRSIKVDQGNKWIAADYDDGLIRIWNVNTGSLVREMNVNSQIVEVQQEPATKLHHRFNTTLSPTLSHQSFVFSSASSITSHTTHTIKKTNSDRILSFQFIGVIPEFCHPIIAEVAARCGSDNLDASQNYLVSAHKSGLLREWDILSGECIQTVKTGHTKDITQLHVVDSRAPHRKLGVTWVFTASKDGSVKCWERKLKAKKATEDLFLEEHEPTTSWTLAYVIKQAYPVTSIATEFPVGGMGVLVTGCSDGTVKVWNFETGESVCTLSIGKAMPISSASSNASIVTMNTNGMRRFAKFSQDAMDSSDESDSSTSSSCSSRKTSSSSVSDHRSGIYQVIVTRYCEVENGPGLCRGCDTCFGNGFLVASNSMDNKVHAWRLERADSGHEGSCTLCTKDYHRKQYKHRKLSISSSGTNNNDDEYKGRRQRQSVKGHSPAVKKRNRTTATTATTLATTDDMLELLDIEQLAGDAHIPLRPTFLGKIEQVGSRGIVFCDKILAGVRRSGTQKRQQGEWEAWFASLQYYDPMIEEENSRPHWKIPIETFNLDSDKRLLLPKNKEEETHTSLKSTLLNLFKSSSSSAGSNEDAVIKSKLETTDMLDEDNLEASENLPFSTIRHIISLDGAGLACDYGNFIKLVYLDKPTLTEKEMMKLSRDEHGSKIVEEGNACECENGDSCCGGVNKEKNGGKCCGGGDVKKKQQEIRQKKLIAKKTATATITPNPLACNSVRSITECSIKNNCSRASECVSTSQAIASSATASSFSNWL